MSNPEWENYKPVSDTHTAEQVRASITQMAFEAHHNSKAKGFWDGQLDPNDKSFIPEKLMLIVSEASEALESYRDSEPMAFYDCKNCGEHLKKFEACYVCLGENPKPCGFSSELADIVIRVGDLATRLGIDLGKAVMEKMAHNSTRERKHGGKVC